MDSEGQGRTAAASDQTESKQQANIGVLAQQFSGLQVGTPPLKEPKGSHGGAHNQCLKQTSNRGKSFDHESHKTSSLQTSDVTLSPVNMSVTNKRKNDEKDTALEMSASKSGCSTGTMRHSETVILEPSVPSHSNLKQKHEVICAGSSTDLDQVTPDANGFNYETTSIDIPISLDEKLKKLSLNSPEILLERGPVSKPRVTRTANDDKPYSRPDCTRPQSTANSSDTSMNYDVDDADAFIRALCKPLDVSVAGGMANCNEQTPNLVSQDCIPSIVFEKMNEKESEKKIPKPRKKRHQVSTKVSEPSSTEHLDASQILNPQSDTNHRDGQSSASVFGGPGQHPEVSVCPLTFTNQATVSQVGNQLPVFSSASQKGLYQQHGIPAVSGSDMCLLTASPMSCGRQQVFSADTLGQQQETFQGMNTSRLVTMAPPTTSVIPDRYGYMTNPEQMQFNSCNPNTVVTIPQQTMPGLVVGNHMNVAQGIVNGHGHGWQNSSCGGQQINYCPSQRNMSKDGGQVVPVQPTTVYPAHITENTNGGHQQNYGVDGSHGQQYIPEGQIGGSMANGLQHMTAGQMGDTMIYGGLGMTSGQIGGTMAHGSQHVTAAQISGAMINGGPHMSTHQIGGTMTNGSQHVTAAQISGAMINGGLHMSPYQIGGTMVNRSQHVTADQIGGTVVNGGQHVTTGQMGGTITNGGQRMTVGQIGGTTANWGQRVPAGQMGGTVTYGGQQMPTGLTGGTLVNGNLQIPAGHMSDTMVNGGQHWPADQVGGTIVHGGQNMTAQEIESIIATGGQQIHAGQIDCVMANAGHQIGNQRMMSSRMSSHLALLITLGQQFQNVPIQNGRRHRKLLPKQKR
ncbi:uncharacterized protein LOC124289816 isoform X2 [Haliotis rubra]|uniref:uncharacterized protein LOC124289816 isoform X2 n=1 Tax=Haliotis rubra TaxID=36100 RepID=UPI001EE580C7|nr:uncharacterized protein LOC124289816 isoform X2 [Haliotis rubra]